MKAINITLINFICTLSFYLLFILSYFKLVFYLIEYFLLNYLYCLIVFTVVFEGLLFVFASIPCPQCVLIGHLALKIINKNK